MSPLRDALRRHLKRRSGAWIYRAETPVELSIISLADRALTPGTGEQTRIEKQQLSIPVAPIDAAEEARLRAYLDAATAAATRAGYASDLAHFTDWCVTNGHSALPAEAATVARYVAALAADGYAVSTLTRRLTAISQAHQARGIDTPTKSLAVRAMMQGIRRKHGTAQEGKTPILPADLREMLPHYGDDLGGRRDKALMLLGFAAALRRSELVALNVADLTFRREGLVVMIRRSKTDQEGEGVELGIPKGRNRELCPVRAVEAWIKAAGLEAGPLFRPVDQAGRVSPERLRDFTVVRVVKRLVEAIGLDPDDYGGHSLRAGLATAAAQAGAEERDIMRQTRHKSEKMVRRYIRGAKLFERNAADGLL
jgi:integrase